MESPVSTVKISVIVPSYNYEDYITVCIDSVLNQGYPEVELIVVDDCSKDNTRQKILSYGDRLTPVFHEKNSGHGGAFNSGFAASSGDLIVFLDADDFLNAGALQALADNYSKDTAMYHYFLDLVDKEGNIIDVYPKREIGLAQGDVSQDLLSQGGFLTTVTSGMSFSRWALEHVLPMDNEVYRQGGDGYLAATVPLYGPVKVVEGCLASYRQHGGNHSKFDHALVNRANWVIGHTHDKFDSIRFHAKKLQLSVTEPLGNMNLKYLEQLMVLRLLGDLSEQKKVMPKKEVVDCAITSIRLSGLSNKNTRIIKAWWFIMGCAPESLSKLLLQWKLEAKSRPKIVKYMSKKLRG